MRKCVLVLLCVLALAPLSALARTWTDNQGRTVEGEFVRVLKGRVVVKDAGGKMIQVPFGHLVEEDQDFVRAELEKHGLGDQLPARKKPAASDSTAKAKPAEKEPAAEEPAKLGPTRTWTDVNGRSVQARLVGMEDGKVVLQVKGKSTSFPFDKFSAADQQYVRGEMVGRGEGDKVPAAAPVNVQPAPAPQIAPAGPPFMPRGPMGVPRPTMPAMPRMPQITFPTFTPPPPVQPPPMQAPPVMPSFPSPAPRPQFVAPTVPSFVPRMPQPMFQQGKKCSHCGAILPNNITAGDHCPQCGVYISYDETNGKTVPHMGAYYYGTRAGAGSVVVALICAFVRLCFYWSRSDR